LKDNDATDTYRIKKEALLPAIYNSKTQEYFLKHNDSAPSEKKVQRNQKHSMCTFKMQALQHFLYAVHLPRKKELRAEG
jgi:hypothetical protein